MIKRQIPNIITLSNLLCGIFAIMYALIPLGDLSMASLFILLGAFFDFFDGLAARLLKVQSEIGKQLDSLADVVTFGVAPSIIAMILLKNLDLGFFTYIPLLMALFSAYRLAKFNIDSRQSTSFIGVPTPANALIWLSIPLILYLSEHKIHLWGWYNETFYDTITSYLYNPYFIIVGSIVMSILLVAELPLLALKFKNLNWEDNKMKFIFIILTLLLIFALNLYSIPFVIVLYIIISLISNTIKK